MINSKFNQKYQEYLKESLKLRMMQNLGISPRENKKTNLLSIIDKDDSTDSIHGDEQIQLEVK